MKVNTSWCVLYYLKVVALFYRFLDKLINENNTCKKSEKTSPPEMKIPKNRIRKKDRLMRSHLEQIFSASSCNGVSVVMSSFKHLLLQMGLLGINLDCIPCKPLWDKYWCLLVVFCKPWLYDFNLDVGTPKCVFNALEEFAAFWISLTPFLYSSLGDTKFTEVFILSITSRNIKKAYTKGHFYPN